MSAMGRPLVVGIGGTMSRSSSSEKALAVSMAAAARAGVDVETVTGTSLDMPMYAPHMADRTAGARHLVNLLRRCHGVIIASPAYHGGISGLIKNALDYTEDLARDERVYLDGCAAGLIGCGAGWQGAGQALSSLRHIAHALRAWPTPLGAALNTSLPTFTEDGRCIDSAVQHQLETVGRQVAEFALRNHGIPRGLVA